MSTHCTSSIDEVDAYMSSDEEDQKNTEMLLKNFEENQNDVEEYLRSGQSSKSHGGSVVGHNVVFRDREGSNFRMYLDYFSYNPRHTDDTFRRRYRMSRNLFYQICAAVKNHDRYFVQRLDAVGRVGFSIEQKVTGAMRILALGIPADAVDEYTSVAESTALESFKKFCRAIIEIFSPQYLRTPNTDDIVRWQGQFSGRSGTPSIILEAVANYDLWIWHAYFGMLGSNNDINVLDRSDLFSNLANGIASPVKYTIGGKEFNMGYYHADGIYLKWSTIVQTIKNPHRRKNKFFA